jgi:hypothetical protein
MGFNHSNLLHKCIISHEYNDYDDWILLDKFDKFDKHGTYVITGSLLWALLHLCNGDSIRYYSWHPSMFVKFAHDNGSLLTSNNCFFEFKDIFDKNASGEWFLYSEENHKKIDTTDKTSKKLENKYKKRHFSWAVDKLKQYFKVRMVDWHRDHYIFIGENAKLIDNRGRQVILSTYMIAGEWEPYTAEEE